jgi:hypothetical protein
MFVVMVRNWCSDFKVPYGPFEDWDSAFTFKEKMETPGSRQSAEVDEIMEPF